MLIAYHFMASRMSFHGGQPMSRSGRVGTHAFTLIELLLVISIIALLVSILLPSLQAARQEGIRLKCVGNLKAIGGHGQNNGVSDSRGIVHPQSKAGEINWIGLGAWDYGGGDGRCGEMRSDWPVLGPDGTLGSIRRPFNLAISGPAISPLAEYKEYRCPGDIGIATVPTYMPSYVDTSPCSIADNEHAWGGPLWGAVGTSYQGDFLWFRGREFNRTIALRIGSFMRPANMLANSSETLLFYEGRFAQAMLSTREMREGAPGFDIPGWHGKMCEFNAVMTDGHAQKIKLSGRGDMVDYLTEFDPFQYPYRAGMARGPGWRYDAIPGAVVKERSIGNP